MPSLVAWRSSETLGEFPAAGGSLACVCVCVSLRLWLGSLSPITKWPVFTFQCGWSKVTTTFGQKQLLFTEMPIKYSQYVRVNTSASSVHKPHPSYRLTVGEASSRSPVSTVYDLKLCKHGQMSPLTPIKPQWGTTILSSRFLLLHNLWKINKP